MIWARDSDNVKAETYLAYLDEEANNDEKEGSERVWIRWDTNLGRKVCLHQSRIVDKLTSRQVKTHCRHSLMIVAPFKMR